MEYSSEFFDTPSANQASGSQAMALLSRTRSGYCEIWRVDRGGRFRVLKCLKKEYRENPLYERLLLKEFEIGYALNHKNICEYYSFLNDAELGNCIEMEWVDGCDLESFLSDGEPDNAVCEKIVSEICSTMQYMHAKQVLHRDLKPSNILITYSGHNVKLIDFGLSDTDSSSILKNPAGTALYAAPEVLAGGKASIASDLYSLGMVMSLFPGRKYSKVAAKLCSSKPEDRYSSVAEAEKALNDRSLTWLWAVASLLIVLVGLALLLNKQAGKAGPSPAPDTTISPNSPIDQESPTLPDSVSIKEAADFVSSAGKAAPAAKPSSAPAAKKPQTQKPASQSTDTTLIDELFRQATELFE